MRLAALYVPLSLAHPVSFRCRLMLLEHPTRARLTVRIGAGGCVLAVGSLLISYVGILRTRLIILLSIVNDR